MVCINTTQPQATSSMGYVRVHIHMERIIKCASYDHKVQNLKEKFNSRKTQDWQGWSQINLEKLNAREEIK